MGQILHGSAKTTYAVRAAIQRSKASIKELAERYDLNPKTVIKWRKRAFVHDAPMGPKAPRSTVLTSEEEALAVAFHTLLPLDDCLYAFQTTVPHLTRSLLHRLFQRHDISRLPDMEGEKTPKKAFRRYPIGYFHSALPLRQPRPAQTPPCNFPRRLQLRQAPQDPQRPHPLRIHLQGLDRGAGPIQPRSKPSYIGTEHLGSSLGLNT
jgi:hypothetical protein